MDNKDGGELRYVNALRFKQWLTMWDGYEYNNQLHGRKPEAHLYMFTMKAAELRQLCDVYRRERDGANAEGIQRVRDDKRTERIKRYVKFGYPYGDLKPAQQTSSTEPLKKPGWLPTSIVVNILVENDSRRNQAVKPEHLIKIEMDAQGNHRLVIPDQEALAKSDLAPLEVIDGQHRLWAFDESSGEERIPDDFELPVVAFHGLDIAWQAYLFWSINVSPVKINPSHAFDLYPLLRTQEWLETANELPVYREARAQELTSFMYAYKSSVWRNRINMLGERGTGAAVSQAAWVRSLLATFLSSTRSTPGLFQSNLIQSQEPLQWSLGQQAAFLCVLWQDVKSAVEANEGNHWWIRKFGDVKNAFSGKGTLLNQDMGVRALLSLANDVFYSRAESWRLDGWFLPHGSNLEVDETQIEDAISRLNGTSFRSIISEFAQAVVSFDWRSGDGPGVNDEDEKEIAQQKATYRGSGGYNNLRRDVLATLSKLQGNIASAAVDLSAED